MALFSRDERSKDRDPEPLAYYLVGQHPNRSCAILEGEQRAFEGQLF
jgi:hypothetical protein